MDFLDPKKQKAHSRRLSVGYALVGIALLLLTTILVYRASGYGLDKKGNVIQNGLVFISSQPQGAQVYYNGALYKDPTNTRMVLPGGQYTMELKRDGYRTWKRAVTSEGGSVGRFDYPFLFPKNLVTETTKQYAAAPLLSTQSPSRQWMLVQTLAPDQFDVYDLGKTKPVPQVLTMPTEVLAAGTTTGWTPVAWAGDNRHVVLQRAYQKNGQPSTEYILIDREDATKSQNLTVLLGFSPTRLELRDLKYDQYYLYDQNSSQVFTASLSEPTPQPFLANVLAFDSFGKDSVVYATTTNAAAGKVLFVVRQGDTTYPIRQAVLGSNDLVALTHFENSWLVAVGSQAENRVYVYKDPMSKIDNDKDAVLVPVQILKVDSPTHLDFSPNSRFVMAENGVRFAMYDAKTDKGYAYQAKAVLDSPQSHAVWMDGFHLQLVSNAQLVVFDFDGANQQTLVGVNPAFVPFFSPNYQVLYALTAQHALGSTAMLVPADQ